MRIRKSASAVVATVIVAALFGGTAGSMTVVAHAESISNKSQTVTLATQALSDRNDLAHGGDGRIAVGDREVVRWHGGIPVAEATNSHQVSTYGWTSWGSRAALFVLRHSVHKLPAKIWPWVNKIADVLEQTEIWEKAPIISPWVKLGSRTMLPRRLRVGSFSSWAEV